ncbi:MAG: glycosyltransferase [Pseudomonadota bacterium]|nr:glycosyltransferase [Pseudomonadota bacterium]
MAPDLSLVICTLDESGAIGPVLREALGHLSHVRAEIIVVDDSADERTADAVRACVREDGRIRLLRRRGERGLATAAAAGWAMARGRVLGLMDGDGQHDPAVLPRLLAGLEAEGADIAVASRYAPGARTGLSGFRHGLSRCGTMLTQVVTGTPTTDPLAGLFLFRREWLDEARPRMSPVGYKVLLDLALSGRRVPKVFETPTTLRPRLAGESKLDLRVIAELAAQLVEKRSGGLLSARFVLFGAVGASGVVVNVGLLSGLAAAGTAFWLAQAGAVAAAMTSNFVLNNLLTFRDRRLAGAAFWRGLLAFYAACTGGALINQGVGMGLHALHAPAAIAGLGGALLAALWNYSAASTMAWGDGTAAKAGGGTVPLATARLAIKPD